MAFTRKSTTTRAAALILLVIAAAGVIPAMASTITAYNGTCVGPYKHGPAAAKTSSTSGEVTSSSITGRQPGYTGADAALGLTLSSTRTALTAMDTLI